MMRRLRSLVHQEDASNDCFAEVVSFSRSQDHRCTELFAAELPPKRKNFDVSWILVNDFWGYFLKKVFYFFLFLKFSRTFCEAAEGRLESIRGVKTLLNIMRTYEGDFEEKSHLSGENLKSVKWRIRPAKGSSRTYEKKTKKKKGSLKKKKKKLFKK